MNSSYKIGRVDKCIIIILMIIQIIMLVAFFGYTYPSYYEEQSQNVLPARIGTAISILSEIITTIMLFVLVISSGIKMFKAKKNYKVAKEKSEMEGTLDPESLNMKRVIAKKTFVAYIIVSIICTILVQMVEVCKGLSN